jgi:glycosyltransferase involved in cell wall biosynthesis
MKREKTDVAKSNNLVNLLVIGQTPPPYVGQMLSIESLVRAQYQDIEIYHTRMNYSQTTSQIGKVSLRKLFHLLRVIVESSYKIIKHRIDVVYYPPGADTVPLLRDIATLLVIRRFRRKLILAFHASGVCERVSSWKGIRLWLFKKAFLSPDAAVQKSSLNPPDGEFVEARAIYTVPNGVADQFERFRDRKVINFVPVILYVGMIREDKGIEVLIEAVRLLRERGLKFQVRIIGEFSSEEYGQKLYREVRNKGLSHSVEFCGQKVGDDKWAQFHRADIFCFPTHYRNESFGVVLIEAMMFELPVVSTAWRGVPGIVEEGVTGFLTKTRDAAALSNSLQRLLGDEELRKRMGRAGRARYLKHFTLAAYRERTREVVLEVAGKGRGFAAARDEDARSMTAAAG